MKNLHLLIFFSLLIYFESCASHVEVADDGSSAAERIDFSIDDSSLNLLSNAFQKLGTVSGELNIIKAASVLEGFDTFYKVRGLINILDVSGEFRLKQLFNAKSIITTSKVSSFASNRTLTFQV